MTACQAYCRFSRIFPGIYRPDRGHLFLRARHRAADRAIKGTGKSDSRDEESDKKREGDQGPDGAQGQRAHRIHDQNRQIHGMADDGIGPGRDHDLILFDLNDARNIAVFPEDAQAKGVTGQNKNVGRNDPVSGHRGPSVSPVKAGRQHSGCRRQGLGTHFRLADRRPWQIRWIHESGPSQSRKE